MKNWIQRLFPSAPGKAFGIMLRWAERGSIFLSCHNLNLFLWASWVLRVLSLLCIHSSWGSYIWTAALLLPAPLFPQDSGIEPVVMLKWCESFPYMDEEKWTRKKSSSLSIEDKSLSRHGRGKSQGSPRECECVGGKKRLHDTFCLTWVTSLCSHLST